MSEKIFAGNRQLVFCGQSGKMPEWQRN